MPRELKVNMNDALKVAKIQCGKLHSMCFTTCFRIFTWGCGQQGRLGHGTNDDVLEPLEIGFLSIAKVIAISAGESHSAAITKA